MGMEMTILPTRRVVLRGWALVVSAMLSGALPDGTQAIEVGQRAPDFNLPATTGGTISLAQFRGKQPVLIEFYGADFAPV
jgi:AhpC/TSA family